VRDSFFSALALQSSSLRCVRASVSGALSARNRLVREPGFVPTVEPDPMNSPRRFEIHHDIVVIENVGIGQQLF
jgi:hypothetical protein